MGTLSLCLSRDYVRGASSHTCTESPHMGSSYMTLPLFNALLSLREWAGKWFPSCLRNIYVCCDGHHREPKPRRHVWPAVCSTSFCYLMQISHSACLRSKKILTFQFFHQGLVRLSRCFSSTGTHSTEKMTLIPPVCLIWLLGWWHANNSAWNHLKSCDKI